MKNIKISIFAFLLIAFTLTVTACGNKSVSVAEAINYIGTTLEEPYDKSDKYDLDERFSHFQMFNLGGQGYLHLNNEDGILAMVFNTKENEDGSVECTLVQVYVKDYGTTAFGWIEGENIKNIIGEDIVFTLVLENNVVTTHDLPELLPL